MVRPRVASIQMGGWGLGVRLALETDKQLHHRHRLISVVGGLPLKP